MTVTVEVEFARMTTNPSANKGEPPSKKRKTDDFEDELWEDDADFTAEFLDDITDQEIRASQALANKPPAQSTASATNITFEQRDPSDTFLKPHLSRSSSSITNHSNSTSSRLSRSSSVLSNNSVPRLYSSDSSYPASLSGYSGTSSSSIRSGDQGVVLRRPSYLSNGSGSDSDHTSPTAKEEIARIQKECAQLKEKVTKLNEELCAKDGENKLLRDNLVKKDHELGSLKSAKVNAIQQQNKQQVEKEKKLQNDVVKLQTQLQFKDQDQRELNHRVRELEVQISHLQAGPASSQAIPHQSSPKPSKALVRDISPDKPSKMGFPTKKTFMATEGSPKKHAKLSTETPSTSKIHLQQRTAARSENKLRLNTKVWKRSRECQLVAKLLDVSPSVVNQADTKSIIGLLNTPLVSSSLQNVQFDRDRDTSLLSPIKSRLSDVNMLLKQSGKEADMIPLVDPDHVNLAMKGLKDLLSVPDTSLSQTGSHGCHMTLLDLDLSQQSDSSESDSVSDQFSRISSSLGQSALDSAILFLPMLQDYLQHYIDMLETSGETSASTSGTSPGSFSESPDSSSESPTGSLGILLRSSTTYANNLESLAIAALKTLCTLVNYGCVRKVLYYTEENNYSPSSESGVTTSPVYTYLPLKVILKLRLLPKVIRLIAVQTKGQLSNREVVETSLTILEILAKHSQGSDVNCLLPLLADTVLQRCVENEEVSSFVLHGLLLFKALCKSKLVVSSLCSNASGCVLLSIYSIGLGKKVCIEVEDRHTVPIIKMVIECIFQIACCHKGGMFVLMDSDCQCSGEVVKCIVLLLYKLMQMYEHSRRIYPISDSTTLSTENQSEIFQGTCLEILENGLLLLHLMSQHDPEFTNRHGPVQKSYVLLICGMSQIVKHLPAEKCESALTAVQDLWDFNQDDSELSPDSDTDMNETEND